MLNITWCDVEALELFKRTFEKANESNVMSNVTINNAVNKCYFSNLTNTVYLPDK